MALRFSLCFSSFLFIIISNHFLKFILEVLVLKFILLLLLQNFPVVIVLSLLFFVLFLAIFKYFIVLPFIQQLQFLLLKVQQRTLHRHHLRHLLLVGLPSFAFINISHLAQTYVGQLRRSTVSQHHLSLSFLSLFQFRLSVYR